MRWVRRWGRAGVPLNGPGDPGGRWGQLKLRLGVCFVVESVAATGVGCGVREELGGLGVRHLDVMWRGHWAAGPQCWQEGIRLGGMGWPLPVPHGLSQAAGSLGSEPSASRGWGGRFLLSRKLLLQTPGICRSRGGPD